MPQLYGLPPGVRVALDANADCDYVSKFGYNADVDASAAPEDIWDGGGLYTGFPTGAAETAQIVSTSTADASGGTGLRTLLLSGLDANYAPQTETLTLNGTTPVTGTKLWTRINRCPGQTARGRAPRTRARSPSGIRVPRRTSSRSSKPVRARHR